MSIFIDHLHYFCVIIICLIQQILFLITDFHKKYRYNTNKTRNLCKRARHKFTGLDIEYLVHGLVVAGKIDCGHQPAAFLHLQAETVLVAIASGKKLWRLKLSRRSPNWRVFRQ